MTGEIMSAPLHAVRIDGGTQSRANLNQETVAEYAEALRGGATFPPVATFFDGVNFWLADGFHRYFAHRDAGLPEIEADVRKGTCRDAVLYSVGANAVHGLRRTNEDKRRAVTTLLNDAEWSKWSDSQIARACVVDHKTVASYRAAILGIPKIDGFSNLDPASNQSNDATRLVERNGTVYAQNTANIGKPKPIVHVDSTPEIAAAPIEQIDPTSLALPTQKLQRRTDDSLVERLRAENEQLKSELADLREAAAEMGEIADNLVSISEGEEAKRLAILSAELRAVKAARDRLQFENAELKRDVKRLQRQIERQAA